MCFRERVWGGVVCFVLYLLASVHTSLDRWRLGISLQKKTLSDGRAGAQSVFSVPLLSHMFYSPFFFSPSTC